MNGYHLPDHIRLLIVDDSQADYELIVHMLAKSGMTVEAQRVETRDEFVAALATEPDAILIDYIIPGFGGQEAVEIANRLRYGTPLIIVSGELTAEFHTDPLSSIAAAVVMKRYLWRLPAVLAHEMERRSLQRDMGKSLRAVEMALIEKTEMSEQAVEFIAYLIELREHDTGEHSRRVVAGTLALAKALGITDPSDLLHIRRGSLLHDVGKIGVPDRIMLKPGPLTPDEWIEMKLHPMYSDMYLSHFSFLEHDREIPYAHHERWDGTGYPRGLKEDKIPLWARIFSIIDVWDAITHPRVYRPSMHPDEARALMNSQRGRAFDPALFDVWWALNG